MPTYIDIHSHVNFAAFDADREAVIERAQNAGVAMINVGTQADTSRSAIELAEKNENMYAIVGLHPVHTGKSHHDDSELSPDSKGFTDHGEEFDPAVYREFLVHPKVVGLGECGLDYFHVEDPALIKKQEDAFRQQIELAIEFEKPLMLHIRNGSGRSAYNDAYAIVASYLSRAGEKLRGNLHFFAGSIEEAKPYLDIGFTFSFTGVITFAREYSKLIEYLPMDRIMSETDCPYVAPQAYRGKRNEPAYVIEVVKKIADIKKLSVEAAGAQILSNASRSFGIKFS